MVQADPSTIAGGSQEPCGGERRRRRRTACFFKTPTLLLSLTGMRSDTPILIARVDYYYPSFFSNQ